MFYRAVVLLIPTLFLLLASPIEASKLTRSAVTPTSSTAAGPVRAALPPHLKGAPHWMHPRASERLGLIGVAGLAALFVVGLTLHDQKQQRKAIDPIPPAIHLVQPHP